MKSIDTVPLAAPAGPPSRVRSPSAFFTGRPGTSPLTWSVKCALVMSALAAAASFISPAPSGSEPFAGGSSEEQAVATAAVSASVTSRIRRIMRES
jgi:hypothetical protein